MCHIYSTESVYIKWVVVGRGSQQPVKLKNAINFCPAVSERARRSNNNNGSGRANAERSLGQRKGQRQEQEQQRVAAQFAHAQTAHICQPIYRYRLIGVRRVGLRSESGVAVAASTSSLFLLAKRIEKSCKLAFRPVNLAERLTGQLCKYAQESVSGHLPRPQENPREQTKSATRDATKDLLKMGLQMEWNGMGRSTRNIILSQPLRLSLDIRNQLQVQG